MELRTYIPNLPDNSSEPIIFWLSVSAKEIVSGKHLKTNLNNTRKHKSKITQKNVETN